jgi:site-specific recombinase XerD
MYCAYAGDWCHLITWCQEHGRQLLPADGATLSAFVTSLAEAGKKVATIQRHCASVSNVHQLAQLPTPTDDRQFKTLLGGLTPYRCVTYVITSGCLASRKTGWYICP